MRRENANDLIAFIAVAREQSFTKAAAQLGVSQSALSYTIRVLETRLGIRLLTRTTRSISLTDAGERLLQSIGPKFDDIEIALSSLSALREKPAGTIRINSVEHAAETTIWPAMAQLMRHYPDINVEIICDYKLVDIVAERFDAGVRIGQQVDMDMIAVRIGPDIDRAVVGSPVYFSNRPIPENPEDLAEHACINLRLPTHGGMYIWDFRKNGEDIKVRAQGRAIFNTIALMREAAIDGLGLAYLPKDMVADKVKSGKLVEVLSDWCPPLSGYHLYYPSRRQQSPAFALAIAALRYKG